MRNLEPLSSFLISGSLWLFTERNRKSHLKTSIEGYWGLPPVGANRTFESNILQVFQGFFCSHLLLLLFNSFFHRPWNLRFPLALSQPFPESISQDHVRRDFEQDRVTQTCALIVFPASIGQFLLWSTWFLLARLLAKAKSIMGYLAVPSLAQLLDGKPKMNHERDHSWVPRPAASEQGISDRNSTQRLSAVTSWTFADL